MSTCACAYSMLAFVRLSALARLVVHFTITIFFYLYRCWNLAECMHVWNVTFTLSLAEYFPSIRQHSSNSDEHNEWKNVKKLSLNIRTACTTMVMMMATAWIAFGSIYKYIYNHLFVLSTENGKLRITFSNERKPTKFLTNLVLSNESFILLLLLIGRNFP